jgi:hypothetical protein
VSVLRIFPDAVTSGTAISLAASSTPVVRLIFPEAALGRTSASLSVLSAAAADFLAVAIASLCRWVSADNTLLDAVFRGPAGFFLEAVSFAVVAAAAADLFVVATDERLGLESAEVNAVRFFAVVAVFADEDDDAMFLCDRDKTAMSCDSC